MINFIQIIIIKRNFTIPRLKRENEQAKLEGRWNDVRQVYYQDETWMNVHHTKEWGWTERKPLFQEVIDIVEILSLLLNHMLVRISRV